MRAIVQRAYGSVEVLQPGTIARPDLAAARTFLCPDGEERLFSWHVRYTPGAGRIHFLPLGPREGCLIGYIGHKLPTVKYPT